VAKEFDAELKVLTTGHVDEWANFLCPRVGVPLGPAEAVDADLSTNVQADRLFRVNGSVPAILHLELESSGRLGRPTRFARYNILAHAAMALPVHTAAILLRPEADSSDLSGFLSIPGADGEPYLTFKYHVIRVWKESIDSLLNAGTGTAPLAILTDEAASDVPKAFRRVQTHLQTCGLSLGSLKELLGSAVLLGGLRYDEGMIEAMQRSLTMAIDLRESSTYRMLIREGEKIGEARGELRGELRGAVRSAQDILLRQGRVKFGSVTEQIEKSVRDINDSERLQRLAEELVQVASWDDLLATP
jgi:hypothetical protein